MNERINGFAWSRTVTTPKVPGRLRISLPRARTQAREGEGEGEEDPRSADANSAGLFLGRFLGCQIQSIHTHQLS